MENRNILMGIISVTALFVIVFGIALIITWPREPADGLTLAGTTANGEGGVSSWFRSGQEPETTPVQTPLTGTQPTATSSATPGVQLAEGGEVFSGSSPSPRAHPVEPAEAIELESDSASPIRRITYENNNRETSIKTESKSPETRPSARKTAAPVIKPAPATKAPPRRVTEYWIQAGSFTSRASAESQNDKLSTRGFPGQIQTHDKDNTRFYRVRIGPYSSKGEADKFLQWIREIEEMESSYVSEVYVMR